MDVFNMGPGADMSRLERRIEELERQVAELQALLMQQQHKSNIAAAQELYYCGGFTSLHRKFEAQR